MSLKVLIPTSGKGVALGEITNYINKALVKVGRKPSISYIIDSYPDDTEFIITVGYLSKQVKDFVSLVYPERKITFVEVDNYDGEGSSLVYSMLLAQSHLQTPFIYQACDTVAGDLRDFTIQENWIAGFRGQGSSNYAGFNATGNNVEKMYEKGVIDPDYIHVGLVGVKDFRVFWEKMTELYNNPNGYPLDDVSVINKILEQGYSFKAREIGKWYDTGNVDGLNKARKEIPDSFHILDKLEESIYIYDDFVVKFFADQSLSDKRVLRAGILKGFVPEIEGHNNNFFRYKFTEGKLYSRSANTKNFVDFFNWSKENLWKESNEVDDETFKKVCYDFYYNKSIKRISKFLESHNIKDESNIINGENIPSVKEIFDTVDFDWLCNSKQTHFHGDFILDNIIQTENGFCLLDWRQDFGGLLTSGDMYYDLSKLNHNLTVNHDIVNSNLFTIEKNENVITLDINRKDTLVQCQNVLHSLILKNNLDLKKVKVLTAIIWLNMSPLHHHPFDKFLFYFGKYNLWKALKETI